MKWTTEAEAAIHRIPFFIKGRVRRKVEEEAARLGAKQVTLDHVHACRQRFMGGTDEDIQGHRVETCFGPTGCPNRAVADKNLAAEIDGLLAAHDLKAFLLRTVQGPLKVHHEFRVSVSDCPNACSRPQIADIGLIGALAPLKTDEDCSGCGACQAVCREGAVTVRDGAGPEIDAKRCLGCGQCVRACPTGTLTAGLQGYRVLFGGKLGRHPQLAREIPGIHSRQEALRLIDGAVRFYLDHSQDGARFGEVLNREGFAALQSRLGLDTKAI